MFDKPLNITVPLYYKLVASSVQIIPIVSVNQNQGYVETAFYPYLPDGLKIAGTTFAGLANNNNATIYQSGSMSSVYRQVNLPVLRDEFTNTFDGSESMAYASSIFIIQIAGAPASTSVAKYTYSYVYEAVSTLDTFKYA